MSSGFSMPIIRARVTRVVTTSHECSDGRKENSALTVWTEPGRVFLHGKLSKAGYIRNINL